MRISLVSALAEFADSGRRVQLLRFLQGLSDDELSYIAEFLGSCVLDASVPACCGRAQLADRIARFQQARSPSAPPASVPDQDHKMIVLLEYLCASAPKRLAAGTGGAGQAW